MISILGIPLDENSSFLKGSAKAPQKIIEAFHSDSTNDFSENGINCRSNTMVEILDSLELPSGELAINDIHNATFKELEQGNNLISIGGDHSITFPIIKAHAKKYDSLNILHFDAHPDLYDNFENNPFSHASPFARIMENNLANRLVQVGIRTLNDHQRAQVDKFGVEVIEMKDFNHDLSFNFDGPVYISLDLDGLDPAYAPGVSHLEPGGLTTRNIINIIHSLKGDVIGGDIVEYNPINDVNDITAITAAKLLKEIIGRIIKSK
jgi:agmatinase